MVSDLLCPISNVWDRDKIRQYLPQYEDHILRIITSSASSPDSIVWLPDKTGSYSIKSGYGVGIKARQMQPAPLEDFNWAKNIWNVKDFLWKLVRGAIPTSSNLARRGVPTFNCKHCDGVEDDLHVFLHCRVADQVWNLAPLTCCYYSLHADLNLENGISHSPSPGEITCVSMALTLMEYLEGKK